MIVKDSIHDNKFCISKIITCGLVTVFFVFGLGDFFFNNGIYNPGDVLFPFNIDKSVLSRLSPWDFSALGGLGVGEGYKSPSIAIYLAVIGLFQQIGLSEEICNRIYIALPYFMLGCFFANFIIIVTKNSASIVVLIMACVFLGTALPFTTIDPILTLGWAFLIYLISLLPRYVEKGEFNHLEIIGAVIALGYLSVLPRLVLLFIIYVGFNIILFKGMIYKYLIMLIKSGLLALPFYFYSIFPLIFSGNSEQGIIDTYLKENRIGVINFYEGGVSISNSILLHYSNAYSMYEALFSESSVKIASFILLAILFIGIKNPKNEFYIIKKYLFCNFLLFLFISSIFGTGFYKFIILSIPGFWILNNPQYLISVLAIFWTLIFIFGILTILEKIQNISNKIIFLILVSISILSINRIMIFNRINLYGEIKLGQNSKYYEIPEYVNEFFSNINCNQQKALILPKSSDGYYTYKFWKVSGMPSIFSNYSCLNTFSFSDRILDQLKSRKIHILNSNSSLDVNILIDLGIKFIIIANDVIESDNKKNIDLNNTFLKSINSSNLARIKYKNKDITIYEIDSIPEYVRLNKEYNQYYILPESERNLIYKFQNLNSYEDYNLKTYFPINSDWNYYLSNNEQLGIKDEIAMLFNKTHSHSSKKDNLFKDWNISISEKNVLRVYLKNNITNYIYIGISLLLIYYILLLVTFHVCKKKYY